LKASESDPYQAKSLNSLSEEEQDQMEANLRGLAVSLKRNGETDEDAFQRINGSQYIIAFKHDPYWPFYDVANKFGRIILTINTAHAFFTNLYEPVSKLGMSAPSDEEDELPQAVIDPHSPTVALDLLLLSLARTQSRLSQTNEDAHKLIETMRREWSESYRVQMA
jgi:hypothetical protein